MTIVGATLCSLPGIDSEGCFYEEVEPQRIPKEHGGLGTEEACSPVDVALNHTGDHG